MSSETGACFWQEDDKLILFVSGRITANEAYDMYQQLEDWMRDHEGSTLFIDMDDTSYIDSTTIGTLIKLHKAQKASKGEFFLCNLSESVHEVIHKTKLDRYFTIIENDMLHEIEEGARRRMPMRSRGELNAAFVLDAHNDILEVAPEMKEKFAGLISVLRAQVDR